MGQAGGEKVTKVAQLEKLIAELPPKDQVKLTRKLEERTWGERLDQLIGKIRKHFRKSLSENEVNALVESVGRGRHEESRR